jgi:hypothetical protein
VVHIIRSRHNKPLTSTDREEIEVWASKHGAKVIHSGKLPIRYGPDGRTPLVMPSQMHYIPESENEKVQAITVLSFKSPQDAQEAAKYIDQTSYTVKVRGRTLSAAGHIPRGSLSEELEAFSPVAKKFGGEVEYTKVDWRSSLGKHSVEDPAGS